MSELEQTIERLRATLNPQGDYLNLKDLGPDGWRVEIEFCPDSDAPVVTKFARAGTLLEALQALEAGRGETPDESEPPA